MTKDNILLTVFLSLALLLTGAPGRVGRRHRPFAARRRLGRPHLDVRRARRPRLGHRHHPRGAPRPADAVQLAPGCTGRIGRIDVTQYAADGVKVAEGAHDLTIGGGSVRCLDKAPPLHQDGVQVMGGTRIAFENLSIDCGRATDSLIDSNFFVNQAGQSTEPPTDVVCDHCTLGGWTAHTANIQTSVRSGVTNSTVCVGRYPALTLTLASDAANAVTDGNSIQACS